MWRLDHALGTITPNKSIQIRLAAILEGSGLLDSDIHAYLFADSVEK